MRRLVFCFFLFASAVLPVHALELKVALGVSAAQLKLVSDGGGTGYRESGLNAVSAELSREICRRISARCAYDYMLFNEMLPAMEAKRYQIGAGNFLRTPEREKIVNFSDSIATSSSRLMALPETGALFSSRPGGLTVSNLSDARVIALAGSVQEMYLQRVATERRLSLLSVASTTEVLPLLRQGKADFWLTPMYLAYSVFGEDPPGTYQFYGPPEVANGLGGTVHMALTKDDATLTSLVNKALAEIRADGSYHRIVRKYFPVSLD
jgi:ABC-type amino acid transport substrate-binding protein